MGVFQPDRRSIVRAEQPILHPGPKEIPTSYWVGELCHVSFRAFVKAAVDAFRARSLDEVIDRNAVFLLLHNVLKLEFKKMLQQD